MHGSTLAPETDYADNVVVFFNLAMEVFVQVQKLKMIKSIISTSFPINNSPLP
jgi:hypothetical protein